MEFFAKGIYGISCRNTFEFISNICSLLLNVSLLSRKTFSITQESTACTAHSDMHTHTLIRTHSESDALSHLLYYECLAHTRRILDTWIVLTIRIAVCNLLTFSTAEWQLRGEGGVALSIGTRSAHFEALKTARWRTLATHTSIDVMRTWRTLATFLCPPPASLSSASSSLVFYLFYNFFQLF